VPTGSARAAVRAAQGHRGPAGELAGRVWHRLCGYRHMDPERLAALITRTEQRLARARGLTEQAQQTLADAERLLRQNRSLRGRTQEAPASRSPRGRGW
jgi:hypothetical protein